MLEQHYTLSFEADAPLTPEDRCRLKEELASTVRMVLVIPAPVAVDQREE